MSREATTEIKDGTMQFLLMIYAEEAHFGTLSQAELQKTMKEYGAFTRGIKESKHLLGGERLEPTRQALTVRVRDGKTSTTHGPFAETREALGGYYLIEAKDIEEAAEIAARIPGAKFGSVEVRAIMTMDPANYAP
ncbi:MAG TPA: YciI family protein [Byssovorax sp.]